MSINILYNIDIYYKYVYNRYNEMITSGDGRSGGQQGAETEIQEHQHQHSWLEGPQGGLGEEEETGDGNAPSLLLREGLKNSSSVN